MNNVDFESAEFIALCKQHHVKELYAFGSVLTDRFTADSDIDFLVEIDEPDPLNRGGLLLSIWNKLETHFNRKIDLLTVSSLRNPYFIKEIESTKMLIYDRSEKEVF